MENNQHFSTFVDDVTISASFEFKDRIPEILAIIIEGGFKISHQKTTYKTNHPNITGVKMGNNYLDVTDKFKIKLQNTEGKSEAQIKGEMNYYNRVRNTNVKK
jgi:RNA-directed DNA polymerase